MRQRGTTLLEALITCVILGTLFLLLMSVYVSCLGVWHKTNTQSELFQDARVTVTRLGQEIAESTYGGLSLANNTVSLVCARREDGTVEVDDSNGALRWDSYHIWYFQPSDGTLRMAVFPLKPSDDARDEPTPVEDLGPKTLADYAQKGRLACANVKSFAVRKIGAKLLEIDLLTERIRYGRRDPEQARRVLAVRFHN